uniref:AsnC family transcriptional regulator n=1 Tax=Halegenticoccus tardaugens TaxID=2071624 RepID=UPI00100BC568|nr:AsnC family transcriptional regulator [Halegenticoccus tardaugens]
MRTLDETDVEILRLLTEDARRPYREIAERVGLSSPAVSDRVTRLQDLGIVRRFTLELDRSKLRGGVPVLVELAVRPDAAAEMHEALAAADGVEHVFVASDPRVFFQARLPRADVRAFLAETFGAPPEAIVDYDVTVLTDVEWTPGTGGTDLALTCAQCGNEVDREGETLRLDGERYYLCCPSCRDEFEARYERFRAGAGAE